MARGLTVHTVYARLPTLRQIGRFAILVALVLVAVGLTQLMPVASAQEADEPKPESNAASDRSQAVSSDQAMPSDRSLQVPSVSAFEPVATRDLTDTTQITLRAGTPTPAPQLTSPGQDRGQLAIQRLEGADACDADQTANSPDVCANPLESRARDFSARLRPQLSAEQRLLAQQYSVPSSGDAPDGTARRLASGRTGEMSNDDLAIAAAITSGQGAAPVPPEDDSSQIPADATDAINAILGVINAPEPR
ncbi:hypothetical protein [Blastomonas sp.]|uniref:hypothetical protein n=1 Tax=Blastomonas sp. TaxID=1909299 RepID=UPI0026153DE6|nr:hypothetical protein [Blastomonas sp.]MDM7956365.1 hypothetical protein [Blastomonas sp.]